jgi:pyruvoyl-dependent arginine decarboxylase (PvlArgDC)
MWLYNGSRSYLAMQHDRLRARGRGGEPTSLGCGDAALRDAAGREILVSVSSVRPGACGYMSATVRAFLL